MTPIPFGFEWFNPDITKLPGGNTFKELTNGLGGFVLVAMVISLLIAAALWALGSSTGNVQLTERGKQGFLGAFLMTLVVGAAAILLNFFYTTGTALH